MGTRNFPIKGPNATATTNAIAARRAILILYSRDGAPMAKMLNVLVTSGTRRVCP